MEEVLNHLQSLSDLKLHYTQEEKQMFIDVIKLLNDKGITVQYMNEPTDRIDGKVIESVTKMLRNDTIIDGKTTIKMATTAQEMFDCINELDVDMYAYNNIMYIYKFSKVKTTNADNPFIYYVRIGKEIEWNEN